MIKTLIIEKEVPIEWNSGITKVKVSFEVPIPTPQSDDIIAMNMDTENIVKDSYQPIIDALTDFLEIVQMGGMSGATIGLPALFQAIKESRTVLLNAIVDEMKADENIKQIFKKNVSRRWKIN